VGYFNESYFKPFMALKILSGSSTFQLRKIVMRRKFLGNTIGVKLN